MKKQYAKQQIVEAIKHWKSVLKRMDKTTHNLLSIFVDKYGNDLVLNDNRSFNLNNRIAYELFDILNDNVFNSKLPHTKIFCEVYNEIIAELKHRKSNIPANTFYGMFNTIAEDEKLKSLNDRLEYRDDLIIINTSLVNNSNFMFACSSLCHEMIHLYGKIYGEESLCDKYWLLYKINIDVHTTPTFIKMKRKANNMGLTVINNAAGLDFSELNSEAFKNMLNSIVNDGINLDENETSNSNIMSKKIPGVGTNISHIDCI